MQPYIDQLLHALLDLGVRAELQQYGTWDQPISWWRKVWRMLNNQRTPGLIAITDGPIKWVREWREGGGADAPDWYKIDFGVPDVRLEGPLVRRWNKHVGLRCETQRKVRLPESAAAAVWKGSDAGLGLVQRLNGDPSAILPVLAERRVRIGWERGAWLVSFDFDVVGRNDLHRPVPSLELWTGFQAIAAQLLADFASSPRP